LKDVENKFISFLEERGVLEEFKANLANSCGSDVLVDFKAWIKSTNPSNFIPSAFPCNYVNEWGKWGAINYKWQAFIKQDCAE